MKKKIFIILIMWSLLWFDPNGLEIMTAAVLLLMFGSSFFKSDIKQFGFRFYAVQFLHVLVLHSYMAIYVLGNTVLMKLCDTSVSSEFIQAGMDLFKIMQNIYADFYNMVTIITVTVCVILTVVFLLKKKHEEA